MSELMVGAPMVWRPKNAVILNEWHRLYDREEVSGEYLGTAGDGLAWFRYRDPVQQIVRLEDLYPDRSELLAHLEAVADAALIVICFWEDGQLTDCEFEALRTALKAAGIEPRG